MTVDDIKTFTYYRNRDKKRGFVVAEIEYSKQFPELWPEPAVVLVEFGNTGAEAIRWPVDKFLALVHDGSLSCFTPKPQFDALIIK